MGRLVAAGLTNRQIAEELVLSTRTVETHVQAIYTRLGITNGSRVHISTWILANDPQIR